MITKNLQFSKCFIKADFSYSSNVNFLYLKKNKRMKSKFKIGDIVVLKSHPLLFNNSIQEYYKLTSPILIVKEINRESKDKNNYSGEYENAQISDFIRYNCTYFDPEISSFKDMLIYESLITSFDKLLFHSNSQDSQETLIKEVNGYRTADYNYGDIVSLKTQKLEILKKYGKPILIEDENEKKKSKQKKITELVSKIFPPFTSPNFILSGIVNNEKNGVPKKKKVAKTLFKVSWYNGKDKKLSHELLPKNFFVPLEKKTS